MRTVLFFWNPINLIDGEGRWFFHEIFLILLASIITKLLGHVILYTQKKSRSPYLSIVIDELYTPLIYITWIFTGLLSLNLIVDSYISQTYTHIWSIAFSLPAIIAFGWFLFRVKNSIVQHLISKANPSSAFTIHALAKGATIFILLLVFLLISDSTGWNFTTILAFGGVGGLALAFASQEIISNFFGGLMLHVTRPFIVGEKIHFPSNAIEGTIKEIGWYQTTLDSSSHNAVYIPNALFTKALLVNKSRATARPYENNMYIKVPAIERITPIIDAMTNVLKTDPEIDKNEYFGVNIMELGPIIYVRFSCATHLNSNTSFYHFTNRLQLQLVKEIERTGGTVVNQPSSYTQTI